MERPAPNAPVKSPIVTPRAWQSGHTTPSDITTVTLGSRIHELETSVVTAVKESAAMVVSIRNQLQEEKEGRERLENKYHELQGEMEHMRQTTTANAGSINQVRGTVDTMMQQMMKAQEESRQQFQLLYEALMKKPPGTGPSTNNNV
jgi:predicted nuclease with TOPRIM domain